MKRILIVACLAMLWTVPGPAHAACPPVQIMGWTQVIGEGGGFGLDVSPLTCTGEDLTGQPVVDRLIHPSANGVEVLAMLPTDEPLAGTLRFGDRIVDLALKVEQSCVVGGECFRYWRSQIVGIPLRATGSFTASLIQRETTVSTTYTKPA